MAAQPRIDPVFSRRVVWLVLAVGVAACGDSTGPTAPVPTSAPTAATTAVPATSAASAPSTVSSAATTETTITAATSAAPTSTTRPEPKPLLLGISIHVEGWNQEVEDDNLFAIHRDSVLDVARVAEEGGAILSFELSRAFVEAATRRDDDVVSQLVRAGHAVGVHADLGGRPIAPEEFEQQLAMMRIGLERLGADVSHVSGVCSEAPWVEAAVGAGYEAATGFVEYCLKSLDELPEGYEHLAACVTPRDCHGTVPTDLQSKMRPWRASSSADWLTHDPAGSLIMIAGDSGHSLQCLGEPTTAACKLDEADATAFAGLVEDYLAARGGPGLAVATVSWSIGAVPPEGFTTALSDAVAPYVASGQVAWASIPDMAALVE